MTTLKEAIEQYESTEILNIADLESFDISEKFEERKGTDREGEGYTYNVLIRDDEEYRVPDVVLKDLKNIIKDNDKHNKSVSTFSVKKKGEGIKTRYTIATLD